jgi:hypothetical protein
MGSASAISNAREWLEEFTANYLRTGGSLDERFFSEDTFSPPVTALYLRQTAWDDTECSVVGEVTFEAAIRGGEVISTKRAVPR